MSRLNPLSLKRPGDVQESATFTDPLQPGQELVLTLKMSASAAQEAVLAESVRSLVTAYVTGDAEYQKTKDDSQPKGTPPTSILDNDTGQPIPVTANLCIDIATLIESEKLAGTPEPYDFAQWVYIADRMPTAFEGAVKLLRQMEAKSRGIAGGNAPRESGKTGKQASDSPSDTV